MDGPTLQLLLLIAALWVAVFGYAALGGSARWSPALLLGLALGAALTHGVWVLMRPGVLLAQPAILLDPTRGATILAVPLGLLLTGWTVPAGRARARYLQASLGSLPLALATARLGCLAAACCHGIATSLPWAVRLPGDATPRHPTPLYEIAGCVALFLVMLRLPRRLWPGVVLAGPGLIRLAVSPWRAADPLGDPLLTAPWLAAAWVAVGVAMLPRCKGAPWQVGSWLAGRRRADGPKA
jgi:hypothetical protein